MIRKATEKDIQAVSRIYDEIHTEEEAGRVTIGWIRDIYPTEKTAEMALEKGDLYVLEDDGVVVAAGRLNQQQEPSYAEADWEYDAKEQEVMVLHTLVVSPTIENHGYGRAFVSFYEEFAKNRDVVICGWTRIRKIHVPGSSIKSRVTKKSVLFRVRLMELKVSSWYVWKRSCDNPFKKIVKFLSV